MFGAYKFRDVIAMQDTGYLTAFALGSTSSTLWTGGSGSVSTWQTLGGVQGQLVGAWQGSSLSSGVSGTNTNFHKLVYRLYVPLWGQSVASNFAFTSLSLGLASLASSLWSVISTSVSSASATSSVLRVTSNWGAIDSANCVAQLNSSAQSLSPNTIVAVLDVRPEKFSSLWPYITPFVAFNGVASGAVSATAALICDAYHTDYEPASFFDAGSIVAVETDYL